MPVKLNSTGGGSVTLDVGSTATNFTQTLPSATTTLVGTDTTQTLTNKTIQGGAITLGTAQASTSGTSIDFTGIPSWVRRITVMFNGVSTNGTSVPLIRLGTSGGVATTGYDSVGLLISVAVVQSTSGFVIQGQAGANLLTGNFVFTLLTGNTWIGSGMCFINQSGTYYTNTTNGSVALGATLDRVRITTTNGTDTFDAGTINIMYE